MRVQGLVKRLSIPCSCEPDVPVNTCITCRQLVNKTGRHTKVKRNARKLARALRLFGPPRSTTVCYACGHVIDSKRALSEWPKEWASTPDAKRPPKPKLRRALPRLLFCGQRGSRSRFLEHDDAGKICDSCYRSTHRAFMWRATAVTAALHLLAEACHCKPPPSSWWLLFKDGNFKTVRCALTPTMRRLTNGM